jgi:hypothetical protein
MKCLSPSQRSYPENFEPKSPCVQELFKETLTEEKKRKKEEDEERKPT